MHFHEGGEGFIEPNAVPPLHRDEIAKPHVGEFVINDVGDVEQFCLSGGGGVNQQKNLAECDTSEVFHCAEREIRDSNQIKFVAWIGNSVVVREVLKAEGANLEGEVREVAFPLGVDDSHWRAIDVDRGRGFEWADNEGHEIGRHHNCLGKAHEMFPDAIRCRFA